MTIGPRIRLIAAAALFLGWMAWLSYAALSKSCDPVVSRAQAAGATHVIKAAVAGNDDRPEPTVKVVQSIRGDLTPEAMIEVSDLALAGGYSGPGDYLLLLAKDRAAPTYRIAGIQRSPGYEPTGKPVIYLWSSDIEAQVRHLFLNPVQ
jgi:hypothetical protein